MDWYMDRKVPHVLGHEVSGIIIESQDSRFPVGQQVFVHHHAPCLQCEFCQKDQFVHCPTWKQTKLDPGGMAEYFAVAPENLADSFLTPNLTPLQTAFIEPLACVAKSLRQSRYQPSQKSAVIGLGFLGVAHSLLMQNPTAFELNSDRIKYAKSIGINALHPNYADEKYDKIIICPPSKQALDFAIGIAAPGATIHFFAPMPPGNHPVNLEQLYFQDITLTHSYSCGPQDTKLAAHWLQNNQIDIQKFQPHMVSIDDLTQAYHAMKQGEILKVVVNFAP